MSDVKKALYLPRFLPYRLTKLSGFVSRSLSRLYSEKFDLTIQEWGIIAILGSEGEMTASQIGELASLDKVNVSRAVDRLEKASRVRRKTLLRDRRSSVLSLTEEGQDVLARIVPLAQDYEDRLLADFSAEEIEVMDDILNRLDRKAARLRDIMLSR